MLKKMGGFEVGKGIGKNNQGIIQPIEAVGKEMLQKDKKKQKIYDKQNKDFKKLKQYEIDENEF